MDIRSINNKDSFIDRSKRSDKTDKGNLNASDASAKAGRSDSSQSIQDNLELSKQKFADDIQFAKQALEQLDRESGAQLREIRQKIRDNDYDNAEIHNRVSDVLTEKLSYMEGSLRVADGQTDRPQIEPLDDETVAKLTQNDEVLSAVTDRLLNDLTQL